MKGLIVAAPRSAAWPWGHEHPHCALEWPGGVVLGLQLAWLAQAGVREVLVVGHQLPADLDELVRAQQGVSIELSVATRPRWQGWAEALRAQAPFIDRTTLVLSDALLPAIELEPALAAHRQHQAGCTLLQAEAPGRLAPLMLLEPGLVETLGASETFEELVCELEGRGELGRAGCPGGWVSLEDAPAYARAVLEGLPEVVHVDPSARIHPRARLLAPAWVGPGCTVGPEAQVGPHAFLARGVNVERGASVVESLAVEPCRLHKASRLHQRLVLATAWHPLSEARLEPVDPDEVSPPWRLAAAGGALDRLLALLGLVLLSPLLLAIALAVYLDDPGPVLYTQLRVGQRRRSHGRPRYPGRVFELYKFRTMVLDAEARREALLARNHYGQGAFFKLDDDPRITRVGRFLRATSLDELPQLLNVVLGDMRLVGNRPLPLYEAEALQETWQRVRFGCPAGITGLWQISGRSDLSEAERLVLDSYYAVSRSVWLDWWILACTLPALLRRRGAR